MKRFTILFAALTGVWLVFGTASTVCADEPQEYFEKTFFAPETPVEGKLAMDAEWRIWIPSDVKTLRGVVVHQHGCGTGSGDGGRTAVYDWHWQALARKHDCALIAVSYRQGDLACELWCDPRNGAVFFGRAGLLCGGKRSTGADARSVGALGTFRGRAMGRQYVQSLS